MCTGNCTEGSNPSLSARINVSMTHSAPIDRIERFDPVGCNRERVTKSADETRGRYSCSKDEGSNRSVMFNAVEHYTEVDGAREASNARSA